MKNINLSVDGGGTSLRVIAFDDDLKLVAQSKSGSVNPNFESAEKIGNNMTEAVKMLLANLDGNFKIKNIYATIVGSVSLFHEILVKESDTLSESATVCNISEGHSHLFAASLGDKGGIALAGTGSGAIYCNKGEIIHLGGYGIPVGDEGSGASIGIQGISAVVKDINGWGEKTLLTEKLYKYLNLSTIRSSFIGELYRKGVNQRNLFAGFCRYVAECEREGDKTARDIMYSAGRDMGLQMVSVIKRAEDKNMIDTASESPVVYASGGAWKGTPYMLETMAETVHNAYPDAICTHGLFDPVMGGVIKFIFDKTGRYAISEQHKEHLKKEFREYLFEFDKF